MDARPLRELLAELVGDVEARHAYGSDPAGYLAAHGHPDLPEPLVAEAVMSYADTAPVEVAEVLAPYVTAHGPVPDAETGAEPADWFGLLTSSDVEAADDPFGEHLDAPTATTTGGWGDPAELDFGAGAGPAVAVEPAETVGADPVEQDASASEPQPAEADWAVGAPFAPEPPIEGLEPEVDEPLD